MCGLSIVHRSITCRSRSLTDTVTLDVRRIRWRSLEAGARHVRAIQDVALAVPHDTVRAALVDAAAGDEYQHGHGDAAVASLVSACTHPYIH